MSEDLGRLVATVLGSIGGVVGLATLVKGVVEYTRQARQKRMELYLELEKRFADNEGFKDIRDLLHARTPESLQTLSQVRWSARNDFAGFFETIAIMVKSGLMERSIACYMFSNPAIEACKTDEFWTGFAHDRKHWWILRIRKGHAKTQD